MANNTIRVTLEATDKASVVIDGLVSKIDSNRGLTSALGKATLGANLLFSAITSGLQLAGNLASKATDLFKEAASTQTSIISTAGNVIKLAGYNFQQATDFVEDFQSQMAEIAASLPGNAADFADFGRGIIDNVIPAFAGLDKQLDSIERKASLERLKDLSKFGTLLSKTAGIDSTEGAKQAGYFLSGSRTLQQLKSLNLYEQNVTFTNELERLLAGRDLRKLTDKERQDIFLKAAQLDKQVLDALSESVEGVFGLISDRIFGLQTGVFGLMRDVDEETEGNQSALKSINKLLLDIFGENGLLGVAGNTLKKLGITIGDPMLGLKNAADSFASKIRSIRDYLQVFNQKATFTDNDKSNDKRTLFRDLFNFRGLGKKIAQRLNSIFSQISKYDLSFIASGVGEFIANVFNELLYFINSLDFTVSGEFSYQLLKALFFGIGSFLIKIDWGAFLKSLVRLFIIGPIENLFAFIRSFFEDASNIGRDAGKSFRKAVKDFFKNIEDRLREALPLGNLLFPKDEEPSNKKDKSTPKNSSFSPFGTGGLLRSLGSFLNSGNVSNGVDGYNTSVLLSAVSKEQKQAPAGSGIVIANSTEAILNRPQQTQLLSSIGANRPSITISSLVINTQATNAREIADTVVQYISQGFQTYAQSRISTSVI